MKLRVKRVYEKPAKADGKRILIDRLWPRGVRKADARIDLWAKELAPSRQLLRWFHVNKAQRFLEFKKRYRDELRGKQTLVKQCLGSAKNITLVTAVKDLPHSHVPTLQRSLSRR